ncbi:MULTISPECIES: alpha/beta hydrolase [unclassified Methylobacterium]|uniref:alpha/beta hydrolase n=1 Tax=unclassified Methylobacterium TaxID=2615210 RepID=UPI0006F3A5B6|nr:MULTISPECIES: alpha/beta hydrolase [unclassified Methylobacterium]KQO59144.1 esterase [Methylobacterium sp. Leaf86]KQO85364.1 esterase [Methylobacterium sp. Leaf91]
MRADPSPLPPDPRHDWSCLDRAARDAAYDNNAAVPDAAAQAAARNAASAAYRAAHPGALDIPYAPAPRTALDLYPAADPAAPCLVFIHGGYWQRNSRELFACFAEGPAAAGWSVAMPGHTLAPEASLTQIVEEIGLALDWLAEHGPAHGLSGPLVLAGWSAGAHLAAMQLHHPAVVAGLAISGVYELGPIRDTGLNQALSLTDAEVAALSPLRLPVVGKPLAIAYGTAERPALVHDARDFHALRSAHHAPGPLLPVVGAEHFSILSELRRPGGVLVRAAIDLIKGRHA